MSRVAYFDVTDMVRYADANDRVSGIQRVQFNLIANLVHRYGGERIRCTLYHPVLKAMVEFDPTPLFPGDEFDTTRLLRQLGLDPDRWLLPSRRSVKRYLHRYSGNKRVRALKKLDVLASSIFMPWRLRGTGLDRRRPACPAVPLARTAQLPRGSACVILSANILVAPVLELAREHARRGEDLFQLVYDLAAHVHPEYFTPNMIRDYEAWLHEMARLEPRVICISEWTARDLREFLGPRAERWDIQAIPLSHEFDGYARNTRVELPDDAMQGLPRQPFVVCVGTLEIRKNGVVLLKAWERLIEDLGEQVPVLVFAGKKGWLIEGFMTQLAASPRLASKVRIVESPTDALLAWLYGHALFSVYPSHYEGWGLPVGESAWFGRFCIASRASSVPEVCGELIDYVDPDDVDDVVAKVRRALTDPDYVRRREAAIEQAPLRRWTDVADDIHRLVMAPRQAS